MKNFIITIDTEGDNLWDWKTGDDIKTENVKFLGRFQELCRSYNFKPVWLSNWEMINNGTFVDFICRNVEQGTCELGMHLHAWNNPPYYELPSHKRSGAPYLTEYPIEVMEQKIAQITSRMKERFGFIPVSHRAGRWAVNEEYFKLLYKYGYRIDCSVTPKMNWKSAMGQRPGFVGPDYRDAVEQVHEENGIIEVPVTVVHTHKMFLSANKSLKGNLKTILYGLKGRGIWLRPDGENADELFWLVRRNEGVEADYLMFMLHSSELMPGGSPTFRGKQDIEDLYGHLNNLFQRIAGTYRGVTLEQYVRRKFNAV